METLKNLEELDAPEYLQDAGLFHSVYGTASFKHQSTNDRNKVGNKINWTSDIHQSQSKNYFYILGSTSLTHRRYQYTNHFYYTLCLIQRF